MRYWDASALAALVIAEKASGRVRKWLEDDPGIVTWIWTRVELVSAVERRFREKALGRAERRRCLDRFDALAGEWDEVADVLAVRATAIPLLARQSLRAADAAQLAAALLVAENEPSSLTFVTLDERLATAAEREGFRVLY